MTRAADICPSALHGGRLPACLAAFLSNGTNRIMHLAANTREDASAVTVDSRPPTPPPGHNNLPKCDVFTASTGEQSVFQKTK